jgi:acyl dehydratase
MSNGSIHRRLQKAWSWDNLAIGDLYGPVVGTVSDFFVKTHAYAVDDYGDWYFSDRNPFGARIGHPLLFANNMLAMFYLGYRFDPATHPGGLHARNEIRLFKPVYVGAEITIRGSNVEKYQKRGRNYRVLECEVVDGGGQRIAWSRSTEIVGLSPQTRVASGSSEARSDAITGQVPAGAPVVTRAGRFVPVGAVLQSITKHTTLEQSIMFSGFQHGWAVGGATELHPNVHTDPVEARERRGQPDALVQGLMAKNYMSQLCTGFFGPLWLSTGRMSVAFIRPMVVRDDITASAMVKRHFDEDGHARLELDVWCSNQRGELTTVGQVSAELE